MSNLKRQVSASPQLILPLSICPTHKIELKPVGSKQELRCQLCSNAQVQNWRRENVYGKKKPRKIQHPSPASIATRFQTGSTGNKSPRWKGGRYAKYGISVERYAEILVAQNNACAVCKNTLADLSRTGRRKPSFHLDHDHKTDAVRGLLCFRCNYGLGWFSDNVERFQQLAEYITSAKDWRDLKCVP